MLTFVRELLLTVEELVEVLKKILIEMTGVEWEISDMGEGKYSARPLGECKITAAADQVVLNLRGESEGEREERLAREGEGH